MIDPHHTWNARLKPLAIGFVLSAILTLIAYFAVVERAFSPLVLIGLIVGCGCAQALAQLICFLQLGIESKPHWNLITFLFMALVLVVVIGGSLWIMYTLDYNMGMLG